MKKLFTLFALFMATTNIIAQATTTFEKDGLWYEVTSDKTVKVIYNDTYSRLLESVTIPASVTYLSNNYSVTAIGDNAFSGLYLNSVTFESSACQNAISDNAFSIYGTSTLTLPEDWSDDNLPIDDKTPWHGGCFRSNRYKLSIDDLKFAAKLAIDNAMGEYTTNSLLQSFVYEELSNIILAADESEINRQKRHALEKIQLALDTFSNIFAQGKAQAFGSMGEEQDGPMIEVKGKDGNIIKLYNIENVKFSKINNANE